MHTELRKDALERLAAGRLVVTVTSLRTQEHITLRFKAKQRGKRNVTLEDASIVAIDAGRVIDRPTIGKHGEKLEYVAGDPVAWTYARKLLWAGNLTPNQGHDPNRLWAAQAVTNFLRGFGLHPQMDVKLLDFCSHCGRELSDPESIERKMGPVCFGKTTTSKHQTKMAA